jgi:lysophospholipase L1-like esterase
MGESAKSILNLSNSSNYGNNDVLELLPYVKGLLKSLELTQLQELQLTINAELHVRLSSNLSVNLSSNVNGSVGCEDKSELDLDNPGSIVVLDYVKYHENFIPALTKDCLSVELQSELNFVRKTPSDKIQNSFISSFDEAYNWGSSNGPVINNPHDFKRFPVTNSIMEQINTRFGLKMNSALVSFYKNGSVKSGLHADNEEMLDSSQPICVLSIGAERLVEFCDNRVEAFRTPALRLIPEDCSLYIMKAGCQELFRHRVRMNKMVHKERIAISFRCFVPGPAAAISTPKPSSALQHPWKGVSPSLGIGNSPGFHYDHSTNTSSFNKSHGHNSERLCLLFGTSITKRVEAELLSKGSRTVVNISNSGARIHHILDDVRSFHRDNPSSAYSVDKIIFCLGTNEMKWFNSNLHSVSKFFKSKLVNLVKESKYLFPQAQIIFHCLLPIRVIYNYTAQSVQDFNDLLYNVCMEYGCVYADQCFDHFLAVNRTNGNWFKNKYGQPLWDKSGPNHEFVDYNKQLYWDNLHLNDAGLKVLCRSLKYIIFGQVFNPLMRMRY